MVLCPAMPSIKFDASLPGVVGCMINRGAPVRASCVKRKGPRTKFLGYSDELRAQTITLSFEHKIDVYNACKPAYIKSNGHLDD